MYNRKPKSPIKQGWVEIGGKRFFARSGWEANIAAYLEFLKKKGFIEDWNHEPKTFWFEDIKRGVRSYLPDFEVSRGNGVVEYWEVKGYMDAKSKTKLNRMRIYHPTVKMVVIDSLRYKGIYKDKALYPGWGALD